jgi:uroporphyrinogen III methyltransferase/synthase
MPNARRTAPGTVSLVGAGPGDPGLITLRAVECLHRADLVLYDYLANPAALKHAPAHAELVCLGHHSKGRTFSPDQIIARTVDEARRGKTVVRLKGGDPSIFGRCADEAGALREAGIPFEIVPGITAALAAAAFCEIPITHHDSASAVALIAGRERHHKPTSSLDYGTLARFPGTLVFYMGVTRAKRWSRELIDHGKPPDTPIAIVRWCTWGRQETIRCTLETVADVVKQRDLCPPAVVIVGDVVNCAPQLSWFTARPLFGERILVPEADNGCEHLGSRLTKLGADVFTQPLARITDPPDWTRVDAVIGTLDQYDWLVFTSGSAIDYFLQRLFDRGQDVRRLGRMQLAAADASTAEHLSRHHLRPDAVIEESMSDLTDRRLLLAHPSPDSNALAGELEKAGARVDQVAVCGSIAVDHPNPEVTTALRSDEISWIAVTNADTARTLARLYGDDLRRAQLASMNPTASAALRVLGYDPAAEASAHTTTGLADAILHAGGRLPKPVP